MRTNAINAVNFGAQLKINCPKDLITSNQIETLTTQAQNIGSQADKVAVNIKKLPSYLGRGIYNATSSFEIGDEKFNTTNDIFYEEAGYLCESKMPFRYIQKLLTKLSEVI